jgi:hypothetical protein
MDRVAGPGLGGRNATHAGYIAAQPRGFKTPVPKRYPAGGSQVFASFFNPWRGELS